MKLFRWVVRICSVLFIAFHVSSVLADSWPVALSMQDQINLVVWGIILLGMLLAWKAEGMGGFVVISGFVIQVALHPAVLSMWGMWVAPAIGTLFVISWALTEERISR